MKYRALVIGSLAVALTVAPILSARAQYDRQYPYYGNPPGYYSNPLLWPFQAAAAVVVGAATLATLPFRAVAGAAYYPGAYYAPPTAYYPPPGYYPPQQGYYAPPQQGYYPPRQGYYAPQQGYYPQQQGYYAPPGATNTPR